MPDLFVTCAAQIQVTNDDSERSSVLTAQRTTCITTTDLVFNVADSKLPHLIGVLDDIRSATAASCCDGAQCDKPPNMNIRSTALEAANQDGNANLATAILPTVREVVVRCSSVGVSIDHGSPEPFQLWLIDSSVVVRLDPDILSIDCRITEMRCGADTAQDKRDVSSGNTKCGCTHIHHLTPVFDMAYSTSVCSAVDDTYDID